MKIPLSQKGFLKKYQIEENEFAATNLQWEALNEIYANYLTEIGRLDTSAAYISNNLMKVKNVHSVRYRVKDAEHVIEKIIRKRIKEPERIIALENYKVALTDLIGLRALHLFKEQWNSIHEFITATWDLKETPTAYFREGDSAEYRSKFEELGCETKEHIHGYRSVHYIVETKPTKKTYYAEIQVRTIFEEAWSEIDHTIRYPYDLNNPVFGRYLSILNRLAGNADEMGTFISFLKDSMQEKENIHRQALIEKDNLIEQLEQKIRDLKLSQQDTTFLTQGLEKLKLPSLDYSGFNFSDTDALKSLAEIALPTYGLGSFASDLFKSSGKPLTVNIPAEELKPVKAAKPKNSKKDNEPKGKEEE